MDNKRQEIHDLVEWLNFHTKLYNSGTPAITDREWDDAYYRLVLLERETGYVDAQSPTHFINFEIKDKLDKITHEHLMLSLDKTKEIETVQSFLGNLEWVALAKMDGLTCSLTYENGLLVRAETRGDGEEGENILHNAKVNPTIPKAIPYKKRVVIDGEIVCTYDMFAHYGRNYKNPRSYASGSIRLLSSKESYNRFLTFVAWDVIELISLEKDENYLYNQLGTLQDWGFEVAPYVIHHAPWRKFDYSIEEAIELITDGAKERQFPIDGIVFKFNDLNLREKLGHTSHHYNNAIAYKFFDELYETQLQDIEWTMGRTGVLTPVAIFNPIDIDGTTVGRASLHNLSVMESTLYIPFKNQTVQVFKANMIIPQIYGAEKPQEKPDAPIIELPTKCPICGGDVTIRENNDVKELYCTNPVCQGKLINRLDHFFGIKGLNAKGISKATFEKLIEWGWLIDLCDMYNLDDYIDLWKQKPGFGAKSVDKILASLKEASTDVDWSRFLCALGIPLIGSSVSKQLSKTFDSWESFRTAVKNGYKFYDLPNFGLEKHKAIMAFDYNEADRLAEFYITFKQSEPEEKENNQTVADLDGKVFVITGKLQTYKNRAELQADIEKHGGKVTGSVSRNTNYLINNDINSTSAKNMQAKKLGIPIISELDYKALVLH